MSTELRPLTRGPDLSRDYIFLTLRSEQDLKLETRLRLRSLLKRVLRDHGFRCIEMSTEAPGTAHAAPSVIESLRESILRAQSELENIEGVCDELDYPLEILDAAIETADAALNQAPGQRGDDVTTTFSRHEPRAVPPRGRIAADGDDINKKGQIHELENAKDGTGGGRSQATTVGTAAG